MIDTNTCCSKRVLIAAAVTAVYTFLYDFIVYGNLLMDQYLQYEKMFRPMEQMQAMTPWCIGYHVVLALAFATGFYCWRDKIKVGKVGTPECPYRKGFRFGLWIGVFMAAPQLMTYMWLPFDKVDLPATWAVAELVKWSLAGFILSKLYKPA